MIGHTFAHRAAAMNCGHTGVVEPGDIAHPTPGGGAKKNSAASLCPLLRDPGVPVPLRLEPL